MKHLSKACSPYEKRLRTVKINTSILKVAFAPKAFDKIVRTVGSLPAESGGALYGVLDELASPIPYVRDFVFDKGADVPQPSYTIGHEFINRQNHIMWDRYGLDYIGHLHSHPIGFTHLSNYDIKYFRKLHTLMERRVLITPVVFTEPDGGFKLMCYLVLPEGQVVEVECCIMDEQEYQAAVAATLQPEEETPTAADKAGISLPCIDYSCQDNAVDTEMLHKAKAVVTGTGGASSGAVQGLVRAGIETYCLIDPDVVEAKNLCRQGFLPRQVGMKKVEALKELILEVNPDAKVFCYPVKLQDLTPEQQDSIFKDASIAIFTTDSFDAQADGNVKILHYNIPAIWAGFYEKSIASEIVFYIPGVTPGCFRCAVSPRYRFQQEFKEQNGKEFSVSSNCNTFFHSALLDAEIGFLALAILHNKVPGKTFSGWFGDYFDRNFIQMKVNPAYKSKFFDESTGSVFSTIWQQVEPEIPPKYELCPDCQGKPAQLCMHDSTDGVQ